MQKAGTVMAKEGTNMDETGTSWDKIGTNDGQFLYYFFIVYSQRVFWVALQINVLSGKKH